MTEKQIPPTNAETKSHAETPGESLWLDTAIQQLKQSDKTASQMKLPHDLNDRYRLQAEVGTGAFGIVYRADDSKLGRRVAIKMLRQQYSQSPEFCERFAREAAMAGQIEHLNVARVYDSHVDEKDAYLVMEFVEGKSLAELSHHYSVPDVRIACRLIRDASDGLSAVHKAGLVHRDVKAANILVTEDLDRVCLTDFGLAQDQQNDSTGIAGSLAYMSPEHLDRHCRIDKQADIFSMGVVLFELLSGTRPFDGTGEALRQQILFTRAPSVIQKNGSVPKDVATIVEKCLRKVPLERYQSAAELVEDLQAWLDGRPIMARPVGPAGRVLRWAKRAPMVASLVTMLTCGVIAAITLGAMSIQEIVRQRDRATASAEFAYTQTDHFLNVVDLTANRIDRKLRTQPSSQGLRKEILLGIAAELQQICEDLQDAPEFSARLVNVHVKIGGIFATIGQVEKTEEQYRQAAKVAESIYLKNPTSAKSANLYASALLLHAEHQGTYQFNLNEAQKSCAAVFQLVDSHEARLDLTLTRVIALRCLADIAAKRGNFQASHDHLRHAIQIMEAKETAGRLPSDEMTRTLEALGDLLFRESAFADSVEWFRKALVWRKQDYNADSENPEAADALIGCLISLSRAETSSMIFVEAFSHGQQALALAEDQSNRFPSDRSRKRTLAVASDAMGRMFGSCGDSLNANKAYGQALKIHQFLSDTDPGNLEQIWDLASEHMLIGDLFLADFRPDRARREYEIAENLMSQIDSRSERVREKEVINQQLATCDSVQLVTAETLEADSLKGAGSLVVGSRLLQLVMNSQYQTAEELSRAIRPIESQLSSIEQFNVACIYAASCQYLATLEESRQTDESKRLAGYLQHQALRVLTVLHQKEELDQQLFGPGLHRTPYLRSLHDQPQMKKILSEISDPLLSVLSPSGPTASTATM